MQKIESCSLEESNLWVESSIINEFFQLFKIKKNNLSHDKIPIARNYIDSSPKNSFCLFLSTFSTSGNYQLGINDSQYNLHKDKNHSVISFIAPENKPVSQWHPLGSADKSCVDQFEVVISKDMIDQILMSVYGKGVSEFNVVSASLLYDQQLLGILKYIELEVDKANRKNSIAIKSALQMAIVHLVSNYFVMNKVLPSAAGGLSDSRLKKVQDYISVNISENISLDDLALVSKYSRYHFLRAFKKSTGLSPNQYLLNKRLSLAKKLLSSTDESITDVSLNVGFQNVSYFSKKFRRHTGMNPSKYRESTKVGLSECFPDSPLAC